MNSTITTTMREEDLMHDLLATEKQIITAYSIGMTETSCPNLKNTLMNNYKNAQDMQFKIFDTMENKGWYQVKDAAQTDVQKAKDSANRMSGELV